MIVLPDGQVESDGGLSRAAATGDRQAFAAIYDRHVDPAHDFCWGAAQSRRCHLARSVREPAYDHRGSANAEQPRQPARQSTSGRHQRSFCHGSGRCAMAARTPRTPPQGGGLQQGRSPHQQQSGGINDRQASPALCPIQRRCIGETRKDSKQVTTPTRQVLPPVTDACEQRS